MVLKKNDLLRIIRRVSKDSFHEIIISVFAIFLALVFSAVFIWIMGKSPLEAYWAMFEGAFGSIRALTNTLSKSIPLIFTGLAVALAFRCGLFNIGAEGQLHVGALVSVIVALGMSHFPAVILLPVTILSGIFAGMLLGGFAGVLKAKLGINEVIVTIMLNYIAILFTTYMINGPFKAPGMVPQTDIVPAGAVLSRIIPGTQLTYALLVAAAAVFLVYWFLWKTSFGYEIRAVGENPTAAESGGINVPRNVILAMALSGGIASLAGVTEVLGTYQRLIQGFSPSFGFTGIAVAVLGRNHPIGVVLTAILFGAMDSGALRMSREVSLSANMVSVIQGLVILFVAMPEIVNIVRARKGGLQ
jgi:general nucleoside transport system permease protein